MLATWTKGLIPSSAAAAAAAALAALLASSPTPVSAASALQYEVINQDSLASAMMMGLINEDYVWILDKVENNPARVPGKNNKPVWGSILSLKDNSVAAIDVETNPFCASGITLGNGTWMVAGGNNAISYGGVTIDAAADPSTQPYQDYDGRKAIRLMDPVASGTAQASISWIDAPGGQEMQSQRWYPGIELLADGSVVLIGGATNGGYINRNYPNTDPAYATSTPGSGSLTNINGGANPSFEFYPSKGALAESKFMINTSGLNMYAHMFLLPSGNIFMQANYSTTIWNYTANTENPLPDMPGQIVRVYPASAAVAMLPLTPENDYTPTILFCGGFYAPEDQWGDYTAPRFNPLTTPSATDCSSITPENSDGTVNKAAKYVSEEQLPEPRTMGQFIQLPTGQMLIVNGAEKGTAGYGNVSTDMKAVDGTPYTWTNIFADSNGNKVYTESMSQDPTYQPVMYDPSLPQGSRLVRDGFGFSKIARLYHSTAILLPDGSVLIGGSNPHMDVSLTMPAQISGYQAHNTSYALEKWYPDYYFKERPEPSGLPSYILYGGSTWTFKVDAAYMGSSANYKANNTKVMVIRGGFSTHAMNFGQRSIQLQHAYTVNDDGSVDYTVMPMPTNTNLFAPGPALLFITIDGVPSKGKYIMVGQKEFGGKVPYDYAGNAGKKPVLPTDSPNAKYDAVPGKSSISSFGIGKIVGIGVAGAALIAVLCLAFICWRRKNRSGVKTAGGGAALGGAGAVGAGTVYGQSAYRDAAGGEYKRVNTPTSSLHGFPGAVARASVATYDSYHLQDVHTPGTPNTPYYDAPGGGYVSSPLAHDSSAGPSSQSQSGSGSGDYATHGWGEHHGGDAGDYYRNNMDRSDGAAASSYYSDQYDHRANAYHA